jgi:zinc protease
MNTRLSLILLALFSNPLAASPAIDTWTTANGARVLFAEARQLPMVDVRIVFDAGSARDSDKAGLATLTNAVLAEGAGGLSAEQISERFEEVGARFQNGVDRDIAWVSLRSITEAANLEPALATLALVLERPDFPAEALERERNRLLIALKQRQQDPGDIAEDAFYANLYRTHPYASPVYGTGKALTALNRADLKIFFQRYYTAQNAVIAMVGDLTQAEARDLANKLVGRLAAGEKAEPLPAVPALSAPIEVKIAHPSSQTHIRFGQPGIARLDPDFYALYVGNHALGGGGFISRLSKEIREKRGLSYSVYSYFLPMRVAGPFMAGLETRNEQVGEALEVLRRTLRGFIAQGSSAQEHQASLKNITGGFPLRIDSNSEIVEYLAMIGFYELPLDYLENFVRRIGSVTLNQIRESFKRRLSVANTVTVIVGGEEGEIRSENKMPGPAPQPLERRH